jgi:hypothetical protein
MRRLRTHKPLVLFVLGVAVFASFLPLVSTLFTAVLTPLWLVLPASIVTLIRRKAGRCDEQTVSLRSLLSSRAPPAAFALA